MLLEGSGSRERASTKIGPEAPITGVSLWSWVSELETARAAKRALRLRSGRTSGRGWDEGDGDRLVMAVPLVWDSTAFNTLPLALR